MKHNQSKPTLWAILLALLASVQLTSAFYDPTVQRWINRDPFPDAGFQELTRANAPQRADGNLYIFVNNAPLGRLDAWGLEPTFKGCRDKQIEVLKKALKDKCEKARDCAKKCPSLEKAKAGVENVCSGNPTINCVADDFTFPDGASCKSLCGRVQNGEIYLCDGAFRGLKANCEPDIGCTLFHEALHTGGLPGGGKVPHTPDFKAFAQCMGCGY